MPDRANGWEKEFVVPKQYSTAVMAALTQNKISSNIRNQIVQDVATKMLSHCKYPSAEQYETVAFKVVTEFPSLKDSMGIGHVSLIQVGVN